MLLFLFHIFFQIFPISFILYLSQIHDHQSPVALSQHMFHLYSTFSLSAVPVSSFIVICYFHCRHKCIPNHGDMFFPSPCPRRNLSSCYFPGSPRRENGEFFSWGKGLVSEESRGFNLG